MGIRGSDKCGGEAGPLVESQLLVKTKIVKALLLKKFLGKAVLANAALGGELLPWTHWVLLS